MENNKKISEIYFSRELFIETIDALQKQTEHDRQCSAAFSVILPNDYISNYDNNILYKQLLKIIQIAMNDEYKDSWIKYYMWELDFGKDYRVGCATMENGDNIDLSNSGKLWDFLTTK